MIVQSTLAITDRQNHLCHSVIARFRYNESTLVNSLNPTYKKSLDNHHIHLFRSQSIIQVILL